MQRYTKLARERLLEALNYCGETGVFTWKIASHNGQCQIGKETGKPIKYDYCFISLDGKTYRAHRLAWFYVHGVWPDDVDHINGDKRDNRIENLRNVSRSVNSQNLRGATKRSKTGLLGASPHNEKFKASISLNRKKILIGIFDTAEEAHEAYLAEKRRVHEGCTI